MAQNQIIPVVLHPKNNEYINSLMPTINGTGEPGSTIQATIDNHNYTSVVLDNGTWQFEVDKSLSPGLAYSFMISQTNREGVSVSSPQVSFKAEPNALPPLNVSQPAENQFVNTATPIVSGRGKPGATVEAAIGGKTYSSIVTAEGLWSIAISDPLAQGCNTISLSQNDVGNRSPAAALNIIVDTIAPPVPEINKPRDMEYINTPKPVITGRGEADTTVELMVDSKKYNVIADTYGNWNLELSEALLDDVHVVSARQRDQAGNTSPEKVILFAVDTVQPGPPKIQSPANNALMASSRPTLSGTGTKGNSINAIVNSKVYKAIVDGNGQWSVKVIDALADGVHAIELYQIDRAGNVSAPAKLSIRIDVSVPAAPVVLFPQADGFVSNTAIKANGTGEPGAALQLSLSGKSYQTKVNMDGSWSVDIAQTLVDKQPYSMTVYQTDEAGNTSPSTAVGFWVDTAALPAPNLTEPVQYGFVNTDMPIFSGTAISGAAVNLQINNASYCATADSSGNWRIQVSSKLPQGHHTAQLSQTAMGNTSPQAKIEFNVKTAAQQAPCIQYPADQAHIAEQNPILKGTGEAGALLNILLDSQTFTSVVAADGSWSAAAKGALPNGIHVLIARQTDLAGNTSQPTAVSFISEALPQQTAATNTPLSACIKYNPPGPNWANVVITTMETNLPVTMCGASGTTFSKIIRANGTYPFEFTGVSGNQGLVTAGVSWIDDIAPVIDITSAGNYFSSDKVINVYKYGPSGLKSALLNGATFEPGAPVCAEGYYTVQACDHAGNLATRSFLIDRTPPIVVGVTPNASYTADVFVTFYDTSSGIKSATLNGKAFQSGTVISANGDYTLQVEDNGGNSTVVAFKINKP